MRLHRPRSSVHPVVQVLLSLVSVWGWMIGSISLICLYGWVFSIAHCSSNNNNSQQKFMPFFAENDNKKCDSTISNTHPSFLLVQPTLHQTYDSLTVCSEAQRHVASGYWVDPNDRRIFARQVETFPQFYISLHNESFDPVRWRIMTEGKYYEQYVYDRFLQILFYNDTTASTTTTRKRTVVLDVGANIGYYTLLSAALGHTVVSFEPNPANLLRLCESIRLNGWIQPQQQQQRQSSHSKTAPSPDIFLLQQAVGDEQNAELMLYTPRNPGMGYLREIGIRGTDTNTTTRQAMTRMIRLDDFAQEQGWLQPEGDHHFQIAILKIDVEGKEPQVVLGAQKLLASGLVRHVLTEGRRFGRPHVMQSFVVLLDAGFELKDPVITSLRQGSTSKEKAQAIQAYYHDKLGPNSRVVTDMWWSKL